MIDYLAYALVKQNILFDLSRLHASSPQSVFFPGTLPLCVTGGEPLAHLEGPGRPAPEKQALRTAASSRVAKATTA